MLVSLAMTQGFHALTVRFTDDDYELIRRRAREYQDRERRNIGLNEAIRLFMREFKDVPISPERLPFHRLRDY